MRPRHSAVPAAYVLLEQDGAIALLRRAGTDYYPGWLCLPSGHVEPGETPRDAAVREALEEVGVSIEPTDLQPVHVRYRLPHDATGDRVDVFFHCCTWRGDVCNAEPDKCSEIAWHPIDDLPTHVIPYVAEVLRAITAGQVYSEER